MANRHGGSSSPAGESRRFNKIMWGIPCTLFFAFISEVLPEMFSNESSDPPAASAYANPYMNDALNAQVDELMNSQRGELDGSWSGAFYQTTAGKREAVYEFDLNLNAYDTIVTGTLSFARAGDTRRRTSSVVTGTYERKILDLITGPGLSGDIVPNGIVDCLMRTNLRYQGGLLLGEVTAQGCTRGSLEFTRG